MGHTIRPGDRVRVVFPPRSVCIHHSRYVNTEGEVGVVYRLDHRFGDHPIIVFNGLWHPPFGEPWVDTYAPNELVPA